MPDPPASADWRWERRETSVWRRIRGRNAGRRGDEDDDDRKDDDAEEDDFNDDAAGEEEPVDEIGEIILCFIVKIELIS